MPISITDPIGPAIARSKFMTFQPFNIGKWFTLGFIVFLATLDEGGGNFRGNYNIPFRRATPPVVVRPTSRPSPRFPQPTIPAPQPVPSPFENPFQEAWDWMRDNAGVALLIGVVGMILLFALWMVILWINSRAKFLYLQAIGNDTYKVVEPWKQFASLGNSLFKFRAVLGAIGLGIFLVIVSIALLVALPDIRGKTFGSYALASTLIGVFVFLPIAIMLSLIDWATRYFITHIMFATGQSVVPSWREFRQSVLPGNRGSFFLFLLMQILLAVAVGIAQGIIGCLTCCIGTLPYLSCVITLPLHLFTRAYPVYFFQQFSPRYQIIWEPVIAAGFPVLPVAAPPGPQDPGSMPPPPLPPPSPPPPPRW